MRSECLGSTSLASGPRRRSSFRSTRRVQPARTAVRTSTLARCWPGSSIAIRASLRWSLVGNAVSVPVAKWLGRRLAKPLPYDTARDGELPSNGRWPKAARFDGYRRYAVSINAYPQWKARPALTEFLKHGGKPLSARATRGFLSRTERAALRFADGFQDRLRSHLYRIEASTSARSTELALAAE